MGEDGDLFVQVLTHGKAFELNRYSQPDGKALVLNVAEVRWLLTAGLPAVLAEGAPLLTPAEAAAHRAAAGRARTPQPTEQPATTAAPQSAAAVPPAEQPDDDVATAAPDAPQAAARPAPGAGVGYTILPGSDDEDAPPPAGGTRGGASATLTIDGMDVGPS